MSENDKPTEIFKDEGIDEEYVKRIQERGENLKPYADAHRRYVRKKKGLGFKSHLSKPCIVCGHRICRCMDRIARESRTRTIRAIPDDRPPEQYCCQCGKPASSLIVCCLCRHVCTKCSCEYPYGCADIARKEIPPEYICDDCKRE